ncbi:MIP/aquaporin family protein [Leeuwenhoekiella sp. H156]|uniref:MIP/aquaporin family protein n=1 Tax=Leeuwenhoekiella sp. H156 TaxID=3450128 RepID=UPI003FA4B492
MRKTAIAEIVSKVCFLMITSRELIGEILGTFVLIIFGLSAGAVAVLFGGYQSIMQIGIAWGISVMLAVYLTRHLSNAHINPAVTLAMVISGRMPAKKLLPYWFAQVLGAFLGGLMLYFLFNPSIQAFEESEGIVRGTYESVTTAKMFGEFYMMPGNTAVVNLPLAIIAEAFGTFLLLLFVLGFTEDANVGRPHDTMAPVFIGISVTIIICLIAPLTQCGINPARDFGPRMVAWIMGWGDAAFPDNSGGFFWVYICGPFLGAVTAALFFDRIMAPALRKDGSDTI